MSRRGDRILDLVEVMDRLRSPGGCPWDARQTHHSLVEYLVEEAYETVEAIEANDDDGLREELGDLLLQVVFHARIAQENTEGAWDVDAVANGIIEKLIRRHPHVFADAEGTTAEQVESNWHALKAQEKGRESVTEGIPESLPALLRAAKVEARSLSLADRLPEPTYTDMARTAVTSVGSPEAFGDLLLALVFVARENQWDAEAALRDSVRRRMDHIRSIEAAE
ncbi:MAG TPA: MazG family protein [Candidatus Nanopelagicales bacterium]|nr:MazG family protein [Candidatus Nanopelagicales bacterium]